MGLQLSGSVQLDGNLLVTGSANSVFDNLLVTNTVSAQYFIGDGSGLTDIGGGVVGTQYLYVMADGTDTENATALQAAYTELKTMSPSATNRLTLIVAPGKYNFGSTTFTMDTQYIDLVSLDGNISIIFNSANSAGTISITANDVFVKGVDVGTKNFTIASNLNLLKVENCVGGNFSFGGFGTASGIFTNCQGADTSFGGFGTASGIFTNCQGADNSFGSVVTASGIFTNCTGGPFSFGGGGTASGTFTNCTGGPRSFGGDVTASGTFTNCQGADRTFGGNNGTASGTFTNCQGTDRAFGGNNGTASGTFTNCTGGELSFGGLGTLNGKLYYCRLTAGAFPTVSGAGITRLCIDGNNAENNQG